MSRRWSDARVACIGKLGEINGKVVSKEYRHRSSDQVSYNFYAWALNTTPTKHCPFAAIGQEPGCGGIVLGRGPTKRLEIIPEKREIVTGGRVRPLCVSVPSISGAAPLLTIRWHWKHPRVNCYGLIAAERNGSQSSCGNTVCVRFQHLKTLGEVLGDASNKQGWTARLSSPGEAIGD